MLDEIIRELTTKANSGQMTSEDVLAWAKRVKVQRAKASMLNDITETKTFDRIKNAPESKNTQGRESKIATHQRWACRYCGGGHTPRQSPAYGKMYAACGKMGHFRKLCRSKRNYAVHKVEIEMGSDSQGEDIETMSVNSLYLNRKWSLIMAHLEMQLGKTALEIPYKINTGSQGNLMPLYIFQKLFKNMSEEQLKRSVKGNIKLKTYNGMHIMQLGMCAVYIKFKNVKKRCIFFVVPGNGQALLGMPGMTALNIINLNIDSIQLVTTECKTNRGQETHTSTENCTNKNATGHKGCKNNNTGIINKQDTKGWSDPSNPNMSINYFYSSNNVDADKRSSNAMTQSIQMRFGNMFNGIGCLEGTFSLQLKPDS